MFGYPLDSQIWCFIDDARNLEITRNVMNNLCPIISQKYGQCLKNNVIVVL